MHTCCERRCCICHGGGAVNWLISDIPWRSLVYTEDIGRIGDNLKQCSAPLPAQTPHREAIPIPSTLNLGCNSSCRISRCVASLVGNDGIIRCDTDLLVFADCFGLVWILLPKKVELTFTFLVVWISCSGLKMF